MHTLNVLVNTCLTFLIFTTAVDTVVQCIEGVKVRRFYVYMFTNNVSIDKIY